MSQEADMQDKASVKDGADLRSVIHNALIDGPRLEDDTESAFNEMVDLLYDRVSAALSVEKAPAVGTPRTRSTFDG